MAQGRRLGHPRRRASERRVMMRRAIGDFRREAVHYGGLLNLLRSRLASQRLARHAHVTAPAGALQIRHTTCWTIGARGRIIIHPGASLTLDLRSGAGFDWRLDRGLLQVLDGTLEVAGAVVLGEGCRIFVKDGGVLRFAGRAQVAGASRFFAHHLIEIGDDALISWGVTLRDADGHAIVQDGAPINTRVAPVRLGRHVWVGQGVDILPGTEIGEGAIIGARSLVKGAVAPHTLVAGVPHRVLRTGIEWRA